MPARFPAGPERPGKNHLCIDDLMPLPAYRLFRAAHQCRLIAHRRARTVALGPAMRLQFEDVLTVRYQIQEVLRAERIADAEGVQHEIDTYAHLLPDGTNWTATLLIELPDAAERRRALPQISLAAHSLYVEVAQQRAPAFANEDLAGRRNARHLERPSGVHFLRFALPEVMRAALHAGASATLACAHERYPWCAPIAPQLLMHLARDLSPASGAAQAGPVGAEVGVAA